MRPILVRMAALLSLLISGHLAYGAEGGSPERQGLFLGGIPAPVLGTTVEVRVTGIIARAKVTQIFTNPSQAWVEGIYIFPLPEDAAVDTLKMTVGDRKLLGVIQEKAEARRAYEAAKQSGTKASLIEQQRPDVFTTSVAHIGPGETVEIAIELQQVVRYEGGRFKLRFPMVVAPRPETKASRLRRLLSPPALRRGAPPINPFAFHADLYPGFPLTKVESPSHAITVVEGKRDSYAVDLAKGVAPANSDLVLEWTPTVGREPRAVLYSEDVGGERYALLMVMPPDTPDSAVMRLPRETVFVVDTSSSMQGEAMEQARQALLLGLDRLQPTDWFNVIRFNDGASALFVGSVPASTAAVDQARHWVTGLAAAGGIKMRPALLNAFEDEPVPEGLVRQVILITAGQVEPGEENFCFCVVKNHLGDRHLFTVALGPAPNVAFLREMAELGRGSFTHLAALSRVAEGMETLFAQLEAPVLHQIQARWSTSSAELWPAQIPDLYLGEPLIVTARLSHGSGPVTVSGQRGETIWEDSFPVAGEVKGAGIDKLWARRKVQSLINSLQDGADREEVKRAVTEIGLHHHLVTDYTSLVAVDVTPTAPAGVESATRVLPMNAPRNSIAESSPPEDVMEEVITVTAEATPLHDERQISTGAAVKQTELEKIPTARDPWALLESTPGVLSDRNNVGGNEGGQQARYVGPDQGTWSADGMVITDTTALGSSPGPYDFDAFEEMQVALSTGEARSLCAEIQKIGWEKVKLDDVLRAAPSLAESLRRADTAGLLRGFLAWVLHGKGCSEPPKEVLAEAEQYLRRFGIVRSQG